MKNLKSRLLGEMQETANGLHSTGLISKRRLGELNALFDLSVENMPPEKIKSLRLKLQLSQAVFAATLNTSISTVQKWEIGDKKPNGPSLRLLTAIERNGLEAIL